MRTPIIAANWKMQMTRPEAETKTDLLDPDGADVTDPFGGSIEIYRRTRDDIDRLLRRRLDDIIAL